MSIAQSTAEGRFILFQSPKRVKFPSNNLSGSRPTGPNLVEFQSPKRVKFPSNGLVESRTAPAKETFQSPKRVKFLSNSVGNSDDAVTVTKFQSPGRVKFLSNRLSPYASRTRGRVSIPWTGQISFQFLRRESWILPMQIVSIPWTGQISFQSHCTMVRVRGGRLRFNPLDGSNFFPIASGRKG